ncbi:cytochrome c oxidase subunit 4 [Georgenia sp. SYP-B2076]|uniref:cytochrome c oxidase subunit 4 n=1 Tax=Georgenia sp. SYP-B2076 TaxID=2495881 RepID=UPI000F8D1F4F|nr:cytochrome c oxidase subunit 4 [Georgenia sp. SYP-B2076]
MHVETILFGASVIFFLPVGLIYGYVADWEPVGTVSLLLLCGMFGLSGGYLWLLGRRVDPRPEDNPTANIEDRAGEVGVFSPHSWWPLVLGLGAALAFAGLALGYWVTGLGVLVAVIGLVGQLFEFSRGQHAH